MHALVCDGVSSDLDSGYGDVRRDRTNGDSMPASAAVVAEYDIRASVDGKAVILVNDCTFGDSLPESLDRKSRSGEANALRYRHRLRQTHRCLRLQVSRHFVSSVQLPELFRSEGVRYFE